MQNRWTRGRSKERGRKSPDDDHKINNCSSDYSADNSSAEASSSNTPTTSPRHRATTLGDSPLAKPRDSENSYTNNNRNDFAKIATAASVECQPSTSQGASGSYDPQVSFNKLDFDYNNKPK